MAEVIRMPRLSDTMTEGVIVNWNKKVGDKIKAGDVLAEVETDKATMEMESYNEGTLLYIGVEKGKPAKVDDVIAIIGKEGEDYQEALKNSGGAAASVPQKEEAKQAAVAQENPSDAKPNLETKPAQTEGVTLPAGAKEIRMPLLSDTMTEGKIVSWNKKVGDTVKADDVLAEVETDKATMDVVGYEDGTLLYIGVDAGKIAKVNQIIAIVGKAGTDVNAYVNADKNSAPAQSQNAKPAPSQPEEPAEQRADAHQAATASAETIGRIKASPLAKKLAQEKGIDIGSIKGSGDGGRITKKDVNEFKPQQAFAQVALAQQQTVQPNSAQENKTIQTASVAPFVPGSTTPEGFTDVPLSQMRKTIARRLGESKFSAPHFYLTMSINMDNAITARNAMNEISPVKISFNDMIIKACAIALRQHPDVNSSFMGDFIRQNKQINIGSALALADGLIVPVIRFADQKSLSQIANEAKTLYQKARDKKLQPNDFSGNTFTVSNLGMMDIDEFTAIINPPDSCIMAVGRIKEEVVKKGDGFGTQNMMKVTLSCDHRAVDGAVGASFLQTFKKFMENPAAMLV